MRYRFGLCESFLKITIRCPLEWGSAFLIMGYDRFGPPLVEGGGAHVMLTA